MITVTAGNTGGVVQVIPSTFPRLTNISKAFEFYRFIQLRARILPAQLVSSIPIISLGYLPEITTETIGSVTATQVSELVPSVNYGSYSTVPSAWVTVPPSVLSRNTPTRWWKTDAATSDDVETTQGLLLVALSSAIGTNQNVWIEVKYLCEFAGAENFSLEPKLYQRAKDECDEKDADQVKNSYEILNSPTPYGGPSLPYPRGNRK